MSETWRNCRLISKNIYRLKNGRIGVRVYETRDGKECHHRFTFHDRAAAETFVRTWHEARPYIRAGLAPAVLPAPETRRTLADILDAYLAELAATGRSAAQVDVVTRVRGLVCGRRLKSGAFVFGALGEHHPVPLSREDLVRIAEHVKLHTRSGGYATRRAFVVLRTAHRRAELTFPTPPSIVVAKRGRAILPLEQLRAFLAAMPLGSVERTAAELVLRTGAREAEALRLRVGDVDLEAGLVRLGVRKGGGRLDSGTRLDERPISKDLAGILKAYVDTLPDILPAETPFLAIDGRELGPETLKKRLYAASSRAGLSKKIGGLGWLRNQMTTLAIEEGASIEVTRRVLGHTTSKTTEAHYDKAGLWPARQAFAESIDRVLKGSSAVPRPGGRERPEGSRRPPRKGA